MRKAAGQAPSHKASMAEDVQDRKRERILESAEDLFFKRGYGGTTIADQCSADLKGTLIPTQVHPWQAVCIPPPAPLRKQCGSPWLCRRGRRRTTETAA